MPVRVGLMEPMRISPFPVFRLSRFLSLPDENRYGMKSPPMKFTILPFALAWSLIAFATTADEPLPQTLMTLRGKLLASEDFEQPLPPLAGKPVGFASGFTGWRYTSGAPIGRSGH